jgi:hypothetical protein
MVVVNVVVRAASVAVEGPGIHAVDEAFSVDTPSIVAVELVVIDVAIVSAEKTSASTLPTAAFSSANDVVVTSCPSRNADPTVTLPTTERPERLAAVAS